MQKVLTSYSMLIVNSMPYASLKGMNHVNNLNLKLYTHIAWCIFLFQLVKFSCLHVPFFKKFHHTLFVHSINLLVLGLYVVGMHVWWPICLSFLTTSFVNYGPLFETSWSLLGLGVEVGLTPNFMKGIHIFPLSIVGSFFFFFTK
jgi:hypothetical protein